MQVLYKGHGKPLEANPFVLGVKVAALLFAFRTRCVLVPILRPTNVFHGFKFPLRTVDHKSFPSHPQVDKPYDVPTVQRRRSLQCNTVGT